MRDKYLLKFKDRDAPSLFMEAYDFGDVFHVEIWDIFTEFNSQQMFEDEKQEYITKIQDKIKEIKSSLSNDKEKDKVLKEQIRFLSSLVSEQLKYKNKRYKLSKEDFHDQYLIISKVFLNFSTKGYDKDLFGNPLQTGANVIRCIY